MGNGITMEQIDDDTLDELERLAKLAAVPTPENLNVLNMGTAARDALPVLIAEVRERRKKLMNCINPHCGCAVHD